MSRDAWAWKSAFYGKGRNLPLVKSILTKEKYNIRNLLGLVEPFPRRVLDIGAGDGSSLDCLPGGTEIVALDRSRAMLCQIPRGENVIPVAGECRRLPVFPGSFSVVTAVGITEYVSDKTEFLREVRRVLATPGFFLVTLSPRGILTGLRRFLGTPLFIIGEPEWEELAGRAGFRLLERQESRMQIQFLYRV